MGPSLHGEDAVLAAVALGAPSVVRIPPVENLVESRLKEPELAVLSVRPRVLGAIILGAVLPLEAKKEVVFVPGRT